jgi:hypothetical protein
MSYKVENGVVISDRSNKIEWQCRQVYCSIHHTQMRVGMRVGFCEHAMRSFVTGDIPAVSRFIAGSISKIERGLMTITFDSPEHIGLGTTCSVEEYSRYCIEIKEEQVKKKSRGKSKKAAS